MGIAVLVRAVDWEEAAWDSVLQGPTERGSQGRSVTMQQTKLLLMMSWCKTTEKKDEQRKETDLFSDRVQVLIFGELLILSIDRNT